MTSEQKKQQQQIKIHFPKELVGGVYANNLLVQHNRDEFIMDFIMLTPPAGTVVSRVISSPTQMKRLANAIAENIRKYEEKNGEIKIAETTKVDFDANLYTKQ